MCCALSDSTCRSASARFACALFTVACRVESTRRSYAFDFSQIITRGSPIPGRAQTGPACSTGGAIFFARCPADLMRPRAAPVLDLASEQQRDSRDGEDRADDREGVAEAEDEGLVLDGVADGDDRFLLRDRRIRDAVREEVVR